MTRNQVLTGLRRQAQSMAGVALLLFPHGGQLGSRDNVRESMLADQLRARERQDVARALGRAQTVPQRRAAQ